MSKKSGIIPREMNTSLSTLLKIVKCLFALQLKVQGASGEASKSKREIAERKLLVLNIIVLIHRMGRMDDG